MNIVGFDPGFLQELVQQLKGYKFSFDFTGNALSLAAYIFLAIGLYTIAQRRNLGKSWLAWVPVANLWLLGYISDHYHSVTKGENRSRRKRILILSIVAIALAVLIGVLLGVLLVQVGVWIAMDQTLGGLASSAVLACVLLLLALPLSVASIWVLVETFCAYYDLFSSCTPENKTLFTVLSIVASCLGFSILASIFIFVCRNKDDGMLPRTQG